MNNIRAITVCVDYADILAVTLPSIMRHVKHLLVVTTPDDKDTRKLIKKVQRAAIYRTTAFYDDGAPFNKGKAMEAGFDVLFRRGWILVIDADIMLPAKLNLGDIEPGKLYSPYRRLMLEEKQPIPPESDWEKLPAGAEVRSGEFAGYFQLFHADDPVLVTRPWYSLHWPHANGPDSDFWQKWLPENRIRPDFEVLHLGRPVLNWKGVKHE